MKNLNEFKVEELEQRLEMTRWDEVNEDPTIVIDTIIDMSNQ